jgi:hypothetical protein
LPLGLVFFLAFGRDGPGLSLVTPSSSCLTHLGVPPGRCTICQGHRRQIRPGVVGRQGYLGGSVAQGGGDYRALSSEELMLVHQGTRLEHLRTRIDSIKRVVAVVGDTERTD